MESLQFIIELLGTFAFAISGIRSASSKNFDWFGGYVVGLATAIGGGTIRDVMLGQAPFWMTNSVYMVCTAFALLTFVMLKRQFTRLSKTWFLFDTLGLALFTIAGLQKTLIAGYPFWVAIIMGCMTGAAGGVLRDVLVNEVPLIFRKEIYAIACILGGSRLLGLHARWRACGTYGHYHILGSCGGENSRREIQHFAASAQRP